MAAERFIRNPLLRLSAVSILLQSFLAAICPAALHAENGREVELIVVEPGDMIASRFGHIGLRVIDTKHQSDMFFDYGNARYRHITFAIDYLKGGCRFFLAKRAWRIDAAKYREENRTIIRQRLNLTADQKERLIRHLDREVMPENREYVYDQLLDNCSTRLRDLLDDVTAGALRRAAGTGDRGST